MSNQKSLVEIENALLASMANVERVLKSAEVKESSARLLAAILEASR